MKRARFLPSRGALVLGALLLCLGAPALGADPEALQILQKIEGSHALGLEAWVEGAAQGQVRVGDSIRFRFRSAADVYLTTVYVDASGALTILNSGGEADRLVAGQPIAFPPEGSNQQMIAQTPLGQETVVAIATREPLPRDMFLDEEQKPVVTLERPEDCRHFARRLADYVSVMPEGSVDIASFSQEIVPETAPQKYTAVSIVDHFTTQTRSLRRRKLDLDIPFQFGSDQLTDEARSDLDELGRALEHPAMKGRHFELAGHTDDVGSAAYNMELSKRRAESARSYLLSHYDVDPANLEATGYGESRPVMPETTPEARRRNRRVVIEQLP